MSWISGPCLAGKSEQGETLVNALLDVADAAFEQGRAVERGDEAAADQAHRAALLAMRAVLEVALTDAPSVSHAG